MPDENGQGEASGPRGAGPTRVDDVKDLIWPKVDLTFPIGDRGEKPEEFIERVGKLLGETTTAVYVDTSFAMWITKASKDTRAQFRQWMAGVAASVHVPVWTYHEYYRHHKFATLRTDLDALGKAFSKAAREFVDGAKAFADQPLSEGQSADAYVRELDEVLKGVHRVIGGAQRWNYEEAAKDVSGWLSERVCRSRAVFDLMRTLGQEGETRYTQDLPPGFMDRVKRDEDEKGSNRFGDLILWEEILAHVPRISAKTVILLTKDRKVDWFAKSDNPQVVGDLLRMHPSRWRPVPAAHPTLSFELAERTCARDLVLLDELYAAALLWKGDRKKYARLIGYAAKRSLADVERDAKGDPVADRGNASPKLAKPTQLDATTAMRAAGAQASATAIALLAPLRSTHLPDVDEYVESFDLPKLSALSAEDAAGFACVLADAAISGEIAEPAADLATKLLGLLPQSEGSIVAAVLSGFAVSAYKDGSEFRPIPKSWDLQTLFDYLVVPELSFVRRALGAFPLKDSPAHFQLSADASKVKLRIVQTTNQTPPVLRQIVFGDKALLDPDVGPALPVNLRRLLGKQVVTVAELRDLVADRFGLPLALMDLAPAQMDDQLSLPEVLGLLCETEQQDDVDGPEAEPAAADDPNKAAQNEEVRTESDQSEDDDDSEDRAAVRGDFE